MKKIFFLGLIISSGLFSCKSNYTRIGDKNANYIPYYLKVNEADSLYVIGNYKRSHDILDSLFTKFQPSNNESECGHEYGRYLMSCVAINDTINIKKKIAYSYKNYGAMHIPIDPIENHIHLLNIYKQDSIYFLKQRNKYLKKIDYDLIKKLSEMVKLDQTYKRQNSIEDEKIDSINSIKLKDVIKNNVYPSYYVVGYFEPGLNDYAQINVLLLHQDKATVFKYLPIIEDAVKKGKCSPGEYAFIYDKCMWVYGNENEKQKFNATGPDNREENDSIVKINRKNIGLPSASYREWKRSYNR
jgi:hypothetical protein